MARRKNSRKKKYTKPVEVKENIVQETQPEAAQISDEAAQDITPSEVTEVAANPAENSVVVAAESADSSASNEIAGDTVVEAAEVADEAAQDNTPSEVTDFTLVMDHAEASEESAEVAVDPSENSNEIAGEPADSSASDEIAGDTVAEEAEVTDAVAQDNAASEAADVSEAVAQDNTPTEVTDFTLVMDPAEVSDKAAEVAADSAEVSNKAAEVAAEQARLEAEYAEARAKSMDAPAAITPVIPAPDYNAYAYDEPAEEPRRAGSGKMKGVMNKPVTRKFLTAALGLTLILNAAVAAGIMALYSHGIKKDVTEVRKTVSELEEKTSDIGGNGPGMGMMPPGMNGNDGWSNGDNWNGSDNWGGNGSDSFGSDDNGFYEDWDDDDDDMDDDYTPFYGNEQGQQSSSGASIGIVINDNNGVYVSQVTGSNAAKAGFQEGDKIISFDGDDIDDSNDLISEVQEHKSGDSVKVVVERNGKQVTLTTTLE